MFLSFDQNCAICQKKKILGIYKIEHFLLFFEGLTVGLLAANFRLLISLISSKYAFKKNQIKTQPKHITEWIQVVTLSTLSLVRAEVSKYGQFQLWAFRSACSRDICRLWPRSDLLPIKINGTFSVFLTLNICSLSN